MSSLVALRPSSDAASSHTVSLAGCGACRTGGAIATHPSCAQPAASHTPTQPTTAPYARPPSHFRRPPAQRRRDPTGAVGVSRAACGGSMLRREHPACVSRKARPSAIAPSRQLLQTWPWQPNCV